MVELRCFDVVPCEGSLTGEVLVPGDKSLGHRALLFGLLVQPGQHVKVTGLGNGADNGRSAKAVAALGARVERDGASVIVHGVGRTFTPPAAPIDCGNSGTTIRLLCGLLAGQGFATTLVGDESLSTRPMRRVIDPLTAMGAQIAGPHNPKGDVVPPLVVGPAAQPLLAMAHELSIASAQVKTALMLAGLFAEGVTTIREPGPSRDHSERMLRFLGAKVEASGHVVRVDGRGFAGLQGGDVVVSGDPSSAAFLLVAALLVGAGEVRLPGVCVNPTRTGFLDVLAAMGAQVVVEQLSNEGPEPVATLVVRGAAPTLRGVVIEGDVVVRAIDELPILAVAAAVARGTTVIRNAEELRVKESDRIAATAAMLRAFGVVVRETVDGMEIDGCGGRLPQGGVVDSQLDHRIAMAGTVAALVAAGPSTIRDVGNVATSYPGFVADLTRLGARLTEATHG